MPARCVLTGALLPGAVQWFPAVAAENSGTMAAGSDQPRSPPRDLLGPIRRSVARFGEVGAFVEVGDDLRCGVFHCQAGCAGP